MATVLEGSKYCIFILEEALNGWQKSDVILEDLGDQVLEESPVEKHLSQDCVL